MTTDSTEANTAHLPDPNASNSGVTSPDASNTGAAVTSARRGRHAAPDPDSSAPEESTVGGAAAIPAPLDLDADIVTLTAAVVDVFSVSRQEKALADAIEAALSDRPHLKVIRDGNTVIARTDLGRSERVVIAGHIDTVPEGGNWPSTIVHAGEQVPIVGPDGVDTATEDRLYGLGSCDMKGGVAVALRCAAHITAPVRDVTYVFYEGEEIEEANNGLRRIVDEHPDWITGNFAVVMEPSNASVEAGCQGTLRALVTTSGRRSHSARSWMGENAIHKLAPVLKRLSKYEPRKVKIDGLEYREGLNATIVAGGNAANVIPDECQLTVNYRYAPDRSAEAAEAHVREVFDGLDVEIVIADNTPGALPGLDKPAAVDFLAALRSEGDVEIAPKFGWTDVARFSRLGIPAVNFGPASALVAHARHEHVSLEHLRSVERRMMAWLAGELA